MDNQILVKRHLEKKKGEQLDALYERYEQICEFHEDPISAALLSTSFYGMEELKMRLPKMNDMLRNPFGDGAGLHAITGMIIMADAGPAEGAKAMQFYMMMQQKGLSPDSIRMRRVIGLLSIVAQQPKQLFDQLCETMEAVDEDAFTEAVLQWLEQLCARRDALEEENLMAYQMLVEMKAETDTILEAIRG